MSNRAETVGANAKHEYKLTDIIFLQQEKFFKEPLIQFDCTSQVCGDFGRVYEQELPKPQFPNTIPFPLATTSDQDCANQSWLPGGEAQHMMLPGEPQFLGSR